MTAQSRSVDSYTSAMSIADKLESGSASLETQSWARFRTSSFSSMSTGGKSLLAVEGILGGSIEECGLELPEGFCHNPSEEDASSSNESIEEELSRESSAMAGQHPERAGNNALPIKDLQKRLNKLHTGRRYTTSIQFIKLIGVAVGLVFLIVISSTMMGVLLFRMEEGRDPLDEDNNPHEIMAKQSNLQLNKSSIHNDNNYTQESLLQLKDKIDHACSGDQLDIDMTLCQHLCKDEMCCFEEEVEYNCAQDRERSCNAHAGCKELVDNQSSQL